MRVLLLHAPKKEKVNGRGHFSIMVLPMGLVALADLTRRLGHDVEILHLGVESLLDPCFSDAAYAEEWRPDLIGYSLHWHAQLAATLQSARRLKEALPATPIVFGGLTAGLFSRELLDREGGPDMVIRGDGERPWTLLLKDLAEGATLDHVPNLCRKGREGTWDYVASPSELGVLRFSSFASLKNSAFYSGKFEAEATPEGVLDYTSARIAYICAGRGCTANCAFCSGGAAGQKLSSRRSRVAFRPVDRLVQDVVAGEREGVRDFGICFDPPRKDDGYFLDFLSALPDAGLRPSLIFEYYNGAPDSSFLKEFARAVDLNRSRLELSPHTGSEDLRASFGAHRYSNAELVRTLRACKAAGVQTSVYFGLLPVSDWEEVRRTADWIARLADVGASQIYVMPIEIEPASPWHTGAAESPVPIFRRSFEDFLRRHSVPDSELSWAERLGYDLPDAGEKLRLLRSAAGGKAAPVYRAAAGI